jgi:hypothetical protein
MIALKRQQAKKEGSHTTKSKRSGSQKKAGERVKSLLSKNRKSSENNQREEEAKGINKLADMRVSNALVINKNHLLTKKFNDDTA